MPECHQENMMRSAKHLNFKSCKTLWDGIMPEIARDCLYSVVQEILFGAMFLHY